jgi:hypothetical protein
LSRSSKEKAQRKHEEATLPPKAATNLRLASDESKHIVTEVRELTMRILGARNNLRQDGAGHNIERHRRQLHEWLLLATNSGQPPVQPQFSILIRKDLKY